MHDYGVLYLAFIIWNEGWFDLVERYGKSLTRSYCVTFMKILSQFELYSPRIRVSDHQAPNLSHSYHSGHMWRVLGAWSRIQQAGDTRTTGNQGGWLRFTKARYLPNCRSEHHTEGDTSIGLAVTEWRMPCRFLDERFFTFRILTIVCCWRKEGKVGEGVHRHPRTTPQWTRTTPSPRKRNLWLLNAQGLHFPRFIFHDW